MAAWLVKAWSWFLHGVSKSFKSLASLDSCEKVSKYFAFILLSSPKFKIHVSSENHPLHLLEYELSHKLTKRSSFGAHIHH